LVPLAFDGPAFGLGAVFADRRDDRLFRARLTISAGFPTNRFSHEAYALALDIRASWLQTVSGSLEAGRILIGAAIPLQMTNMFFSSWDDSHLYWLTSYMLGVTAGWEMQISDRLVTMLCLELPLLGFVSRPPPYRYEKQEPLKEWTYHFTAPNSRLHFESLGTYRSVSIEASLTKHLTASAYCIALEFDYHYCSTEMSAQTMNTRLTFSYLWGI